MRVEKKKYLFFVILLLSGIMIQAQSLPFWLRFEQGKRHYRNGDYGDAILAFEDARRSRWDDFTRMESDLILALSTPELRQLGDTLDWVERYIFERRHENAARALRELYFRVPKENLGGSVNRALEELDRLKAYPEAEFWLGETFRAEGELSLALRQYQKAYDERKNLETPGFEIEILYRMVEIHRIRQEYRVMESLILDILRTPVNNLWATESFARAAMMRILENDGIDRFLILYRYNNPQLERAHRLFGLFCFADGRHTQAAEHLMFASLIQSTVLIEEIMRQEFDFTFSTLDSLMGATQRRPDLLSFMEEIEYFRTLYFLSVALQATGRSRTATQIWTFLSGREEAGLWRNHARSQLQSPFNERAIQIIQ